MFHLATSSLGITLVLTGGMFIGLSLLLLRALSGKQPVAQIEPPPTSTLVDIPSHHNAVIVVEGGGRVLNFNSHARQWFDVQEKLPDLEHLSRRCRPSETLLKLCAAEGQAKFALNGKTVEGNSYRIPYPSGNVMVVTLQTPKENPQTIIESDSSDQSLQIINKLSASTVADLALKPTLKYILESIEEFLPADATEVTIWDEDSETLQPYRLVGLAGLERNIEKSFPQYQLGKGFSGYIAEQHKPLLISSVASSKDIRPTIGRAKHHFQSYLGVPLLLGENFLGTLEIMARNENVFTENDLAILELISGQAAIAIYNSIVYEEKQERTRELSNLAELSQTSGSSRDISEFFSQLLKNIPSLLETNIAGFLIYDENRRVLEAQNPFIGIPPHIVEMYKTEIPIGSAASQIWEKEQTIMTAEAAEDPRLQALGIDHIAQAAGIHATLLVPLTAGGRNLGYLQVGNKKSGGKITENDKRLLEIIAGQTAPIIENAELLHQSIKRALRSEAIRRIANLAGSEATTDEILKYSLLELVRLINAEKGAIFLFDEKQGKLELHIPSGYQLSQDAQEKFAQLANISNFHKTVTYTTHPLFSNQITTTDIPPLYQKAINTLEVASLIVVPLIIRDRGIGEILLSSSQRGAFQKIDQQLASAIAGQIAIALDKASLATETDDSLRQRVEQLTGLTRVSQALNSTLNLETLIQLVFDEAIHLTQADCGIIFLLQQGETKSAAPEIMFRIGDDAQGKLHPLEEVVLTRGETVHVEDYQSTTNSSSPPHSGVRSSLIAPIIYEDQVAGLIHLHSRQPEHFTKSYRDIIEALSLQASIALGNAQQYQRQLEQTTQLSQRVKTLSNLFKTSEKFSLGQPLEETLEEIAYAMQASTPFAKISISTYNETDRHLHCVTGAGFALSNLEKLKERPQSWKSLQGLLQDDFKFGRSYFIPVEDAPSVPTDFRAIPITQQFKKVEVNAPPKSKEEWHAEDIFIIPLQDASEQPLGLISIDVPEDGQRPTRSTIETLEIFASLASSAIESNKKLSELTTNAALVAREAEINRLETKTRRFQSGLEIISTLNRQPDRESILKSMGDELVKHMAMHGYLIAEPKAGGVRLLHAGGDIPSQARLNPLLGQQNPLIQSLRQSESIYAANIEKNENWANSPLLKAIEAKGMISLPITTFAGAEAAILIFSKEPIPEFSPEEIYLYELLGQQTSYIIQSVKLLTETSERLSKVNLLLDFGRKLDQLNSEAIIQTLLEGAQQLIHATQGAMVLLKDQVHNKIMPRIADGYRDSSAMLEITFSPHKGLVEKVFRNNHPLRLNAVNFAQDYMLEKDNLLAYRKGTGGVLPISCLAVPIETRDNQIGIIILENFEQENAFSVQDQALLSSLSQQTALTLENVQLIHTAEQRAAQLEALTQATSILTSSGLQRQDLIDSLLKQLAKIVPYDTGALWLHEAGQLVIHTARGFENNQDLIGISTQISESKLMYEMIRTGEPLVVPDIKADARFPAADQNNSWLGVPLLTKDQILGVIALEKHEPGFYTPTHTQMLQTFGSQAAIAIENAGLYQESVDRGHELDQRTQRLAMLNQFSNKLSSSLNLEESFQITLEELARLISHSIISGVLWTDDEEAILQIETPKQSGLSFSPGTKLPQTPIFEHLKQSQGVFVAQNVAEEEILTPLRPFFEERKTKSALILPLIAGDDLRGFLFIHSDSQYRFSGEEIELARITSNQAAIAIHNAFLKMNLEKMVLERTQELKEEHDRAQTLLQVLQALSASLDLDEVLHHTLGLLNSALGADQSTILLIQPGQEYLYYRAALGYMESPPRGGCPSGLKANEGLAGWAISHNQCDVVDDVLKDDRWLPTSTVAPDLRSAIVAPIAHGADILGAISLFHRKTGQFNKYQRDLVHATAKQIAVAINNTQLVAYIQEQTNELGQMLRMQKVESSRSRAILESVADGVIVTNANREITLFNASSEAILNLSRNKVIGKTLEQFSGLFGESAQDWIETIQAWSTGSRDASEVSYSEQITLENGAIVSVQLAPVTLEDEFLGTVSNFRDITHLIEVDRLKSEFVATVSHELRTPMTSIKGYVDVLLMGAAGEMTEQQNNFLNVVKENTSRLETIVDDLLDISRLEAGRISISIQPTQPNPILKKAWQHIQDLAEKEHKKLTFKLDIDPNLPIVNADSARLRQILDNLIENAYHYTPEGGTITLCAHAPDEQSPNEIQIDVKDTGVGIPASHHEEVFDRFYRGENPLVIATSGTGLGLSIVQQLVQMLKGRIWLESSGIPGEGTTFSFTIPIHQEA